MKESIVERRKTLVMEICLTARQEKQKKSLFFFFVFFSGLLFVSMLQFFAEVHSFLLLLELEFLLLRGFECGDGESRLLFLSRHLGKARTNFGHLLQLRLHEFSLNVVNLDGQLVDVRVLLDESVLEVDGVNQRLPHLLVQLDASVLQRGGVEPIDVKGADFSLKEVILGLLFHFLLAFEVILSAFQDQNPQLLLLVGGQLKFLLFSHSGFLRLRKKGKRDVDFRRRIELDIPSPSSVKKELV